MKWHRKVAAIGLAVLAMAVCVPAEPIAQLQPTNYVNDFAGVLDAATATRLNDLCRQVEEKAKAQIAVVTVKSVDGQDVVSYAGALYQKWGIGAKGKDRGVLILLATQDRKYWTTVGYGLEPILPDGKVGGFGREAVPLLRSADYAGAVSLMTSRVAEVIAKDAGVILEGLQAPPEPVGARGGDSKPGVPVALVLFFIFLFVMWIFRRAGGGGSRGGGGSGLLSGILWGLLAGSMRGGRGGYGGGGFGGGGFGGGGGGFGGFGGGSTGGGGAGGSW